MSTLNVYGPPSPEGATGFTSSNRSLAISFPFCKITTSRSSSLSIVPMLLNCPVTVTKFPGSGWLGLKLIPLPSLKGAKSEICCETSVSPIRMSRVPSPSISATAGADQTRCGILRGDDHPLEIADEEPSSPLNAHSLFPNGTINS